MESIIKGTGYNLHLIDNNLHKIVYISVKFRNVFDTKKRTLLNILKRMLLGSLNLPSKRALNNKLDELYGAGLNVALEKLGLNRIINFELVFPNPKYLNEDITGQVISLLKDVIYTPYILDESIYNEHIEEEKNMLRNRIKSLYDDKTKYAITKTIKSMYHDQVFALNNLGEMSEIDKISYTEVLDAYHQMINNDVIDIYVAGDISGLLIEKNILDSFKFTSRSAIKPVFTYRKTESKRIENVIFENADITQGKLNIGFNTNIMVNDPLYYPMIVFSELLGGFVHSKLFQEIREKNSLCYYIGTIYYRYKGCFIIYSGIDVQNYQITVDLIKKELEKCKNRGITNKELILTKKCMINSLKENSDSISVIVDRYYNAYLNNEEYDLNKLIQYINSVTIIDLEKVANLLVIDTIFFLKGGKNGQN